MRKPSAYFSEHKNQPLHPTKAFIASITQKKLRPRFHLENHLVKLYLSWNILCSCSLKIETGNELRLGMSAYVLLCFRMIHY